MKLLFDQNLSHKLARRLADLFPDSTHVREVGLKEAEDPAVWEYAKQQSFMIVSKDVARLDPTAPPVKSRRRAPPMEPAARRYYSIRGFGLEE